MDELIKTIVEPFVDHPDDIHVTQERYDSGTIDYVLTVHKEDMGKVIGKHGRIATAVRTVVQAAGAAHQKNVNVAIRE